MNTENLSYLQKNLLNLGFGEKLNADLEKQIKAQKPEFVLTMSSEYNKRQVNYDLHFKAGNKDENYFFNKFDARIKDGKEDERQTFYINRGNGITAKEAFNLIEGRSVNKQLFNGEGEKYTAWLKLDKENLTEGGNRKIRQFNENYGFRPEELLKGKGIKEMDGGQNQDNLMRSLRKGNAQQITVERDGKEQKLFISANPQFKTVDLYDGQMKKIKREELLNPASSETKTKKKAEQKDESQEVKQEKKPSKKRGMAV